MARAIDRSRLRWAPLGAAWTLLLIMGYPALADDPKDPESKAVLAKLEEKIPLKFEDAPLEDVMKFIRSATMGPNDAGIPYAFDKPGMERTRKEPRTRVTIESQDEPLKTALRRLLKSQGLTYTVKKGVLTITAED